MGYPHWKDLKKTKDNTQTIAQFVQDGVEYIAIPDGAGHYFKVAVLTTAQRDALSPTNGMIVYNSTTNQFERYQAGGWGVFGASGATTFSGLTDTPGSYSGQSGRVATVKATEDGLEFGSAGAGDMLKSTYDPNEDGVVKDSDKLEGSTKAQVQDHTPKAHAASHQNGGGDEIGVAGLSGELADPQPPKTHKASHENAGGDEISLAGLSGAPADTINKALLTAQGQIIYRGASVPAALAPGVDGQFLKTQGAGANPVWADAGGGFDIFDKYRECITWGSIDGWTTGGEGTVTPRGRVLSLWTTSTIDSDAFLKFTTAYSGGLETGKKLRIEYMIEDGSPSNVDRRIWLRASYGTDDPPSDTTKHVGFKIDGADIYATNANGTSSTSTDTLVDLATGAQMTRLRLEFTKGTNCKFYVNGVLKATHTTNLPDIAGWGTHLAIRTLAASTKMIYLGRIQIEQEY